MDDSKYQEMYDELVKFVGDSKNSARDVKKHWNDLFKTYYIRRWRYELKNLSNVTGVSLNDVCRYMGKEEKDYPGFYKKLPKRRKTYIGVGMAYGQSLDTINRWIRVYGMKRELYAKDVLNDLIWIYLIQANQKNRETDINYYQLFDACRGEIETLYEEIWDLGQNTYEDTVDLEKSFSQVEFDTSHTELKMYVRDNINSFRTAYIKPRKYLNFYVMEILRVKNASNDESRKWTLNSLRGWLDDSMINYLSGSYEYINALDKEKNITSTFKHVPKNKKAHVAICLALGMSVDAINEYLVMMGYAPLDAANGEEGQLINLITRWDMDHMEQARFKDKYFRNVPGIVMTMDEELKAVNQMLFLREDISQQYESIEGNGTFGYL